MKIIKGVLLAADYFIILQIKRWKMKVVIFFKKKEFCLLLINPISPEKTNGKVGGYQVDI